MACRVAVGMWLVSALLVLAATETRIHAADDDEPVNFLGLSLEDLMQTELQETSVLRIHTHWGGEWMFGYKLMPMMMSGLRDGTPRRTVEDVLQQYMVAPTSMRMEMHMVEVMYAPSDTLTLMAMAPYIKLAMDHRTRMGGSFTTATEGLGDVTLTALYSAIGNVRRDRQRLIVHAGVSVPTGSIDERGTTPMGTDQKLPYAMQLGSGTYDLHPGVTYLGESVQWAWAADGRGTLRLGVNDQGYRLGNGWQVSASLNRRGPAG
jgi:hypothetical protein